MPSQPHFWRLCWLIPLLFSIQMTWLAPFQIAGVPLDLAFGAALGAAVLGGARIGFWAGAGAGLLAALAAMWHPGSFLLSRLLPCVIVGMLSPRFQASHPLAPPIVALLGAIMGDAAFLLLSPTDLPVDFWKNHVLGQALGQAALAWPLFWLVQRVIMPKKKLVWG